MTRTLLSSLLLLAIGSAGVLHAGGAQDDGRRAQPRAERREPDTFFHRHGYTRLDIPKGHYPPPGECRVWFPERPPGQQPPPGDCRRLRESVPLGAWLIRHPSETPDHVHVTVYDDRRPRHVLAVGEFRIGSGVFVRVILDP